MGCKSSSELRDIIPISYCPLHTPAGCFGFSSDSVLAYSWLELRDFVEKLLQMSLASFGSDFNAFKTFSTELTSINFAYLIQGLCEPLQLDLDGLEI